MLKDARRCAIHAKRRPERAGAHHPAGDSRGGDRHGNLCLWWRQPRLSRDEARGRAPPPPPAPWIPVVAAAGPVVVTFTANLKERRGGGRGARRLVAVGQR